MNIKKIFTTTVLIVITVLIALGGVWQSSSAKSGIYRLLENETIELGKQGLHATNIPVGVSHVYMTVVKGETLPPRFNHDVEIEYRAPAMEVRFLNQNGGEIDDISALVYVYFNIGKVERDLWFDGGSDNIAIWYVSEETGKFEMCPTYFVRESLDNGKYDRLACLAPGSGYFVLGAGDFDVEAYYPNRPADKTNSSTTNYVRTHIPQ